MKINRAQFLVLALAASSIGMLALVPKPAHADAASDGARAGQNAGRNAANADQPPEQSASSSGGCCG